MASNKFPGTCGCGAHVAAQAGTVAKSGSRWIVTCENCRRENETSGRTLFGAIYWPNGLGYTECTEEYEDAHEAMLSARDALDDLGGFGASNDRYFRAPEGYAEAYEAYCRAQAKLDQMQGEGGHLGASVRFDKPDAMTALLGGGRVKIAPGGSCQIAEA